MKPVESTDAAALRPFLLSVSLELLQRAALHRDEYGTVPRTLGLSLRLVSPPTAPAAAASAAAPGAAPPAMPLEDEPATAERSKTAPLRPRRISSSEATGTQRPWEMALQHAPRREGLSPGWPAACIA